MFNYKKVKELKDQINDMHNTQGDREIAFQANSRKILLLERRVKEVEENAVQRYKTAESLIGRYLDTVQISPEHYNEAIYLDATDRFERMVGRLEQDKINRVERAKIEFIVRDLLKKNVFKEVKE